MRHEIKLFDPSGSAVDEWLGPVTTLLAIVSTVVSVSAAGIWGMFMPLLGLLGVLPVLIVLLLDGTHVYAKLDNKIVRIHKQYQELSPETQARVPLTLEMLKKVTVPDLSNLETSLSRLKKEDMKNIEAQAGLDPTAKLLTSTIEEVTMELEEDTRQVRKVIGG